MKKIIAMLKGKDQSGISVILVAMLLTVLVGFVAFAIDIGYNYVARNQVQNAADAGALAGTRFLINNDGTINVTSDLATGPSANQIAFDAATANTSTGNPVTVTLPLTNIDDVQRGHWSFGLIPASAGGLDQGFYPNPNSTQTGNMFLAGQNLDADINFINAVKVVTHNTQIPSFFGRIFSWSNYQTSADAVAYLGFGSRFQPGDFDQPIAICSKSIGDTNNNGIIDDEETLTCNIGRMLNSSSNSATNNTAGWTNFSQPCENATSPTVLPLICTGGNDVEVNPGTMGTIGGTVQNILTSLRDCWLNKSSLETNPPVNSPDQPWNMTLPVIKCPTDGNVGTCSEILGAVNVSVVWITDGGFSTTNPPDSAVPHAMYNPQLLDEEGNSDPNGLPKGWWIRDPNLSLLDNWDSFVDWFGIVNQPDAEVPPSPAPLAIKSIYFMPSCQWTTPVGTTGGNFFGVPASVPVLVE